MTRKSDTAWKAITAASIFSMLAIIVIAAATKSWFLTALPIGFLFGFFLEKADLCGASAFSEAIMFKDWRKIQGLWVLIVTSMTGFAILSLLGIVTLSPKPLEWATMLVGGLVFGSGMVLAGGCISGALYKSGAGNLNSMAALVGIPLGVALVEYGPLHGFQQSLKHYVIAAKDGGPVTLSSLTGLPFGVLALLFAALTAVLAYWLLRRKAAAASTPRNVEAPRPGVLSRIATRPWKPWQAGIAIGVLAGFAYLSSAASGRNYPLGVTHGVLDVQLLLTDYPLKLVSAPSSTPPRAAAPNEPEPAKKVNLWLVLEVTALVAGANVSARLTGRCRLLPKPPDETVIAFLGGIVTGAGAGIAGYCVVGGIMSGWALMSVASVIFGLATVAANWVMTYFYLMGGKLS